MKTARIMSAVCAAFALAACSAGDEGDLGDLGPLTGYDDSGAMPCSAGAPTYDEACGWRVVRKDGGAAEIWIANIAVSDTASYRVLEFANGEFVARDGTVLGVSKDGDTWLVSVPDREYYRFPGSVITG